MHHRMTKVFDYIRSIFLSGLFALLPLTLTILLINISLTMLKRWLNPVLAIMPEWLQEIPYVEIVFAILFIFLIGFLLQSLILNNIVRYFESLIAKIPFVKPIYSNIKQMVRVFAAHDQETQKVVLIEFPRKGSYSIGFLTGKFPTNIMPTNTEPFFNIFIPTTPNPTSGFYIVATEADFITIDLSRQEALALIMSGGVIAPDRFTR